MTMTKIEEILFRDDSERDSFLERSIVYGKEFLLLDSIGIALNSVDCNKKYFNSSSIDDMDYFFDKYNSNIKNKFDNFSARRKALRDIMDEMYSGKYLVNTNA